MRKLPPQALLRELLNYDPETGIFVWKVDPRRGVKRKGTVAGTNKNGYVFIGIPDYWQIQAHRLAWIYMYGPTVGGAEIDHADGNRSNNAISNLRLATRLQQNQNRRVQSNNRSGLKGAYYHAAHKGKKWRTQIKVEGKLIFLGYYRTAEEAHAAYQKAAAHHFGEFARVA